MLAGRLQRSTTSLAARVEDAVRIRLHLPSATGSGAALCRGLRASSRRYHRPTGQIQQPGRTQDWIKLGGKVRILEDGPASMLRHNGVAAALRGQSYPPDFTSTKT